MEKYYLLSWKNGKEPIASAFSSKVAMLTHELIEELNNINELPFEFKLIKLKGSKNGLIKSNNLSDLQETWLDYQPNNLAFPLMSEKLKSVIEMSLTGNEQIDWIACKVKNRDKERRYFILRFNKILDVLDMQKTMFVQGTDVIIKPVFSLKKTNKYSIFMATTSGYGNLWKITSGIYISENLKKAIQKQKLTGIDFEKASVI